MHEGINLSQTPDLLQLQQRLHQQLASGENIPKKATTSVEAQVSQLRKAAQGKVVLITLDDMWDSSHEAAFECVDLNGSKLMVTTRIKGVLLQGTEIELELLGMQESVALLAAVAQLDSDTVPPVCLEIAHLKFLIH